MITTYKEGLERAIKSIGQSLINRAEDIANDTRVMSLTIHAEIKADEIINYDITKNYSVDPYTESLIKDNKEV